MVWLRRGWLCAIACTMVVSGASALLMRYELWTPEPTLAPELYSRALGVHGFMALLVLVAAVIAIPTLLATPARAAVAFGAIALAVWTAAVVLLLTAEPSRFAMRLLAASLGFAAAQLAVSLRGPRPIAAIAGLVAIASGSHSWPPR